MRLLLLSSVALIACTADAGGDPEPAPVVERELVASDGSREFPAGWWDTRHRLACSFTRGSDGRYRCLPGVVTSYEVSLEPDCSEPVRAVIYRPEGFFRTRDGIEPGILPGFWDLDRRFGTEESYRVLPLAGCVPFFDAGWTITEIVPDPPMVEVADVSTSALEITEGDRLRREGGAWYDPVHDTACEFASIAGQVRCYPTGLERIESLNLFANPACDRSEDEVVEQTGDRWVVASPSLRVLEVVEPYDGPLFARTFTSCVATEVELDVALAHPVGDSLVRGLLIPGPELDSETE